MTMASVPGFLSEGTCKEAGEQTKNLVSGTVKKAVYICVRQ
jgi:hypothetical protein